mmetsp:Transcript_97407/g.231769  ORF Transcript_97407/g.231769 Transcript_97407/m.231769 type:complete len:104 (+) Transcript_97407:110-421(+)
MAQLQQASCVQLCKSKAPNPHPYIRTSPLRGGGVAIQGSSRILKKSRLPKPREPLLVATEPHGRSRSTASTASQVTMAILGVPLTTSLTSITVSTSCVYSPSV